MKKVSTITPCYNGEKYLRTCWESLKNQTIGIENMECIFVDDCSSDSTWEILQEIEREYPENVVITRLPENMRQGGARNVALGMVSGEYIQFLDQDDWLEETALLELYSIAKEYDTDMIQFDFYHEGVKSPEDRFCARECMFELKDDVDERKEMLVSGQLVCSHHNIFYRTDLVKRTGSRFPERMLYEEPLFVYPMYFTAERIRIITNGLYHMRSHEQSSTETLLSSHLEDHSKVQKMLLDFLEEMPGVVDTYEKEIEFYFVWSYYAETVINIGRGGKFSLEMMDEMQKTVINRFPDYMENRYLKAYGYATEGLLGSVQENFSTVEEMKQRCFELSRGF